MSAPTKPSMNSHGLFNKLLLIIVFLALGLDSFVAFKIMIPDNVKEAHTYLSFY